MSDHNLLSKDGSSSKKVKVNTSKKPRYVPSNSNSLKLGTGLITKKAHGDRHYDAKHVRDLSPYTRDNMIAKRRHLTSKYLTH